MPDNTLKNCPDHNKESDEQQEDSRLASIWTSFLTLVFIIVTIFLLNVGIFLGIMFIAWAKATVYEQTARIIGIILLALGSGLLFWFRRYHLFKYGMVEILFAGIISWKILEPANQSFTKIDMFAMGASAYLIVRGLDNCKKSLEKRKQRKT